VLGENDRYEPLCRACYLKAIEEEKSGKGKGER